MRRFTQVVFEAAMLLHIVVAWSGCVGVIPLGSVGLTTVHAIAVDQDGSPLKDATLILWCPEDPFSLDGPVYLSPEPDGSFLFERHTVAEQNKFLLLVICDGFEPASRELVTCKQHELGNITLMRQGDGGAAR